MDQNNCLQLSFLCLLLLTAFRAVEPQTIDDVDRLLTNLFGRYDSRIRPVLNQSEAITVNTSVELISLFNFNEVEQTISFVAVVYLSWFDPRLEWDLSNYSGIHNIGIPAKDVWKPKLVLGSAIETIHVISSNPDWTEIRVAADGAVSWSPGDSFTSSCPVNIRYFPFDSQECRFIFLPFGLTAAELTFVVENRNIKVERFTSGDDWYIENSEIEAGNSQELDYAFFIVRLTLIRKPMYYVGVLVPVLVLSILNTVVFGIPIKYGERISFSMTILLAFIFYLALISTNIPKKSTNVPIISIVILVNVIHSALMCIEVVAILQVYHRQGPVPQWVQSLMAKRTNRFRQTADNGEQGMIDTSRDEDKLADAAIETIQEDSSRFDLGGDGIHSSGNDFADEVICWDDVGGLLDRVCQWVSIVLCVLTVGMYPLLIVSKG